MKEKRKAGLNCLHIKFMLVLFVILVSVSFVSAFNLGSKALVLLLVMFIS